jgi:hypothetical protein
MTIKEASSAARRIIAKSTVVDVHDWITEKVLRDIGAGFHIPATAYADADDVRTQGNLSAWLRRNVAFGG